MESWKRSPLPPLSDEALHAWRAAAPSQVLIPVQLRKGRSAEKLAASIVDQNVYQLQGHAGIALPENFEWTIDPNQDRNWCLWLNCLAPVSYLVQAAGLSGVPAERAGAYTNKARDLVESWLAAHLDGAADHEMAWHDHVVALRAMVLLQFAEHWRTAAPEDPDLVRRLFHAVHRHGLGLLDPKLYRIAHNHGIDQDKALLAISLSMPQLPEASDWERIAVARLAAQIEACITPDGCHKEHSPDYEALVCLMLADVERFLSEHGRQMPEAREASQRLYRKIAHTLKPDGYWPIVGDTLGHRPDDLPEKLGSDHPHVEEIRYALTGGAEGRRPAERNLLLPDSGCAVFRETWSPQRSRMSFHCYFTAAFHSRIHKHRDDLSFVCSAFGRDILVEGGRYSYDYHDPLRRYCESVYAHNVVIVNDEDTDIARLNVGKSGLSAVFEGPEVVAADGVHYLYPKTETRRLLVYLSPDVLVVFDRVSARQRITADQQFLLAPGLKARREGDVARAFEPGIDAPGPGVHVAQLLEGRESMSLAEATRDPARGWTSRSHRTVEPCTILTSQGIGEEIAFLTVFALQEKFNPAFALGGRATWDGRLLEAELHIGDRRESLTYHFDGEQAKLECRGSYTSPIRRTPFERENNRRLGVAMRPTVARSQPTPVAGPTVSPGKSERKAKEPLNMESLLARLDEKLGGINQVILQSLLARERELERTRLLLERSQTKRREAVARFRELSKEHQQLARRTHEIAKREKEIELRGADSKAAPHPPAADSALAKLREEYAKAKERIAALVEQRDRYKAQAHASKLKLDQLSAACEKARSDTRRERNKVSTLQNKCQVWAAQIEDLEHSVRWRLGDAIVSASRSPLKTLMLPTRLARLFIEGRKRERERIAPPKSNGSAALKDNQPSGPPPRRNLNVACILDEFSLECFRPEASLHELTINGWRKELEASRPDMLLVESAWRGREGQWRHLVTNTNREGDGPLKEIVDHCRKAGIPTVFWNKEDPANFEHFIGTAKWFDVIFTTDSDCIDRYREIAGHDRVLALPFAAQECIHNPLGRRGGEWGEIAFAGTWYSQKHDGRREDAEVVLEPALDFGLHIYDRRHTYTGPGWMNYQWPQHYQKSIRGGLPYEQMLEAYRKYHIFLNVNSVRNSPTMCARRVFELLACGTAVVSGYAPAIENMIGGELVALTRTADETRAHLQRLLTNEAERNRIAVRGVRKIMSEHTYVHRFASIMAALGKGEAPLRMRLACLLPISSPTDAARADEFLAGLCGVDVVPVWISPDSGAVGSRPGVKITGQGPAAINEALKRVEAEFLLLWTPGTPPGDWPADLVQAFRYFDGDAAGKPLDEPADQLLYRAAQRLPLATTVLRLEAARKLGSGALAAGDDAFLESARSAGLRMLATDTVGLR